MAKFLSSDKIKVFPTAFRGKDANGKVIDPNAFLTTEENFVNIANKVLYKGKNYFFNDGDIIHLILGGYYFVFNKNDITSQFTSDDVIWAGILVNNLSQSYESYTTKTLTPKGGSAGDVLDVGSSGTLQEFKGLSFVGDTDPDLETFTYKLPILEFTRNGWKAIKGSMLNLSTQQIADGNISEDGTSNSISDEFTTAKLNADSIYTDKVEFRGDFDAIYPKLSSNRCTVGTQSSAFNSGYFKTLNTQTLNVQSISGLASMVTIDTENIELVASSTISNDASTISNFAQVYTISASSNITLRTSGTLSLSAASTHANIYSSGINLSTNGNISLNASVISINTDDYACMYSPSIINLSTSTYALRLQDKRMFFGYGSNSCMFETSTNHTTNFAAVYASASLCIKDFKSISIDDYKVRPYEHRMMITLSNSASNKATIIANPKLFTSQSISTKSELLTALNSASYFIQMSTASGNVYSPLVATGKFYNSGLDTLYDVMGIGVGTYGSNSVLYLMCWEDSDNSKSLGYDIVDIDSYTFEIKDLV